MENEIGIQRDRSSQSESGRSRYGLHKGEYKPINKKERDKYIRYFSMFTGIGGFEFGFKGANDDKETRRQGQSEDISKQGVPDTISESNKRQSTNDLSKTKRCESWRNEKDSSYTKQVRLASKQFTCVGMSEIDKYSNQILRYKFPNIKNWGDCTKIRPKDLPDFDMLCGGFPCQAFSIAGKRKGFEDIRGTMFFEIARILKVKRPKTLLLENVKGLLNHNKGETFKVILQTLDELGYEIQWMVLNSKFFGVPQNRERVFIIGNLRGERRPEILPFRCNDQEIIREGAVTRTFTAGGHSGGLHSDSTAIIQLNNPTHSNNRIYGEDGISPSPNTAQGGNRQPKIRAVLTPDRANKRQNGRRFKEPGEPSFTLTGQDIHGICKTVRSGRTTEVGVKGYSIRRLTPVECCRLQGFPDDWNSYGIDNENRRVRMSDTQRYKQMGNAVTTNVIQAIGEKILNEI